MPGPPPKDPKTRQRRNKVSTAATLPAAGEGRLATPALPKRQRGEVPWHPETVDYWKRVWASEMAGEYLDADIPGLIMLMKLQDRFNYGELELAAEIRLQRQCFGLTSLDRRRLQWQVGQVQRQRPHQPQAPVAQPTPKNDPRKLLRMVR
jgi:hypothetical protein